MACACKNKRSANASVKKTPIRSTNTASNGKTALGNGKRIIRREIK